MTIAAVSADGLQAVDRDGYAVALTRAFIEGHRRDGSRNCSHAWARTVDGVQGGTWPQIHLLGTAALERFTGYTAQSRGRHATDTWNVNRLPDIDYGGVLADQRTPEKEVLDAMRRVPDTGFPTHDAPSRVEDLLLEQADLRRLLEDRPPDVRPALRRAESGLASAEQVLFCAHHRLRHAEERLERLGPLSQLGRHGRQEKASALDDIDRFTAELHRAEAKTDRDAGWSGTLNTAGPTNVSAQSTPNGPASPAEITTSSPIGEPPG